MRFGLSWLRTHSLSETTFGTGPWVSKNWDGFNRLSAFLYGYCQNDGDKAKRQGAGDISRAVCAFSGVIARVFTHGGVDDDFLWDLLCRIKEFMSCLRELDLRKRHESYSKDNPKQIDQSWTKSNYLLLFNLPKTIAFLGPMVNYFDGSGKGEKVIQIVKPTIPKGVRDETCLQEAVCGNDREDDGEK